jgi:hypothetical protein
MPRKKRTLTLTDVTRRLLNHRDTGGLVYIKHVDENGEPMNFRRKGSEATSGVWKHGLTSKKLEWILIYQLVEANRGIVWMGELDRTEKDNRGHYTFHLSNMAEPLVVNKSFRDLTGKAEPQHPGFLTFNTKSNVSADSYLVDDLQALAKRPKGETSPTDMKQLILARLGQGKFRSDVLKRWHGACAVTGCNTLQAIRASHIVSWRDSNDADRLSPTNGLPLIATLDALFDRWLISFSRNGEMLVSPKLSRKACVILGIPANLKRSPDSEEEIFLKKHRKQFMLLNE